MSNIIINSDYIIFIVAPTLFIMLLGFVIHYMNLRKKVAYLNDLVSKLIKKK